jgi:hypothetical protein
MMLSLLLTLALSTGETAPPPVATQRLAVLKITAQGASPEVAETLTQVVTEQAGRTPGFSAISQAELGSLLGVEKQKQLLGCGDQSCLAEIGGALGARLVLSGSLGRVGESYVLQLQLLDTQKAQIRARESRTITGPQSELLAAARDLTSRVLTGKALDTTGKIKFAITPSGAKVVVDGKLIGTTPLDAPVMLEQGTHRVHVEADGYVPFDAALDAVASQTLFNSIDLVSTAPLLQGSRRGAQGALGWAAIGIGLAAGAAGVVCGVLANKDYTSYQAAEYRLGGGTAGTGAVQERNDTQTFATAANISYLGAGVFGLIGIGLEIWALATPSGEKHVEVSP